MNGGDFKAAKAEVFRIIGRHGEQKPRGVESAAKSRIVAEYDYTDLAGELLYQVIRLEPKGFRQRRPGPNGESWIWNLKGVEPVPYNLPAVFGAEAVYIVEGEKDVHTLEAWGLVATCNSGGAGKWRADFAGYFEGKHVAILPDQDEPGRNHGLDVAASLTGTAASVRVVDVVAKDVTEWANSGGTKEVLRELVRNAENHTAETLAVWQGKHRGDKVGLATKDDSNTVSRTQSVNTNWPDPLADEAFHGLAGEIVHAVEPHTAADPGGASCSITGGVRQPHGEVCPLLGRG